MVPDIMMKGLVASYLASSQGMDMIHNYIQSEEGYDAIKNYLASPRGKQSAGELLPLILDAVDLPEGIRNSVRENLGKKN
jgi:hypothetical protein